MRWHVALKAGPGQDGGYDGADTHTCCIHPPYVEVIRWNQTRQQTAPLSPAPPRYLGGDGRSGDMGRGAVLGGRHAAVLLLLVLLLTLHALVLRLAAWRTVGRRREGRGRRRQVLQLVGGLLHLHHRVPQEVDCMRQCRQDELEAFLPRRGGR